MTKDVNENRKLLKTKVFERTIKSRIKEFINNGFKENTGSPLVCFFRYILPLLLVLIAVVFSFFIGRYPISLADMILLITRKIHNVPLGDLETVDTILFKVRLPRILAALIVGSALSLSGTVFQSTFRNPMVSPGVLGVANGAGLGAALGILFSMSLWGIQVLAFLFGLLAVGLAYLIGNIFGKRGESVLMLVLAGMVISTVFSSFISLTKYVADPDDKLPAITYWLMGSLSGVDIEEIFPTIIIIFLGSIPLFFFREQMNILSFGDEEAKSMGVNTSRLRLIIIICSTVITAASISISGIVGWIGLVIPHISRMISGPNHRSLVPMSVTIGAVYLLIVDNLARTAVSVEIPLGIITSLLGAPFFIWLMLRRGRAWK